MSEKPLQILTLIEKALKEWLPQSGSILRSDLSYTVSKFPSLINSPLHLFFPLQDDAVTRAFDFIYEATPSDTDIDEYDDDDVCDSICIILRVCTCAVR